MINPAILDELLTIYPTLNRIPATLQKLLPEVGQYKNFATNQIFFDLESPCQNFPFLISGSIRVIRLAESGREILLYHLRPGEICILTTSCLLGGEFYEARGIVEKTLAVVTIPQSFFVQLIEQAPDFRSFVFRFFGQRMSHLMILIEEISFRRLDQRIAAFLLAEGPTIEITHQQLARDLGSVREVVNRLLQEFKAEGAIELERGHIYITNRAILEKKAYSST